MKSLKKIETAEELEIKRWIYDELERFGIHVGWEMNFDLTDPYILPLGTTYYGTLENADLLVKDSPEMKIFYDFMKKTEEICLEPQTIELKVTPIAASEVTVFLYLMGNYKETETLTLDQLKERALLLKPYVTSEEEKVLKEVLFSVKFGAMKHCAEIDRILWEVCQIHKDKKKLIEEAVILKINQVLQEAKKRFQEIN